MIQIIKSKKTNRLFFLSVIILFLGTVAFLLENLASVHIGPYIRIGLSSLPNRIVDYLLGPVVGASFGAVMNCIKYAARPEGVFFPGFMLSAATASFIYGTLLHNKPVHALNIIVAEILVKLLVNCGLNTLWLSMCYGQNFIALFPIRAIKNLAELPFACFILYGLLKTTEKIHRAKFKNML